MTQTHLVKGSLGALGECIPGPHYCAEVTKHGGCNDFPFFLKISKAAKKFRTSQVWKQAQFCYSKGENGLEEAPRRDIAFCARAC